jgi:hypothetical protein
LLPMRHGNALGTILGHERAAPVKENGSNFGEGVHVQPNDKLTDPQRHDAAGRK